MSDDYVKQQLVKLRAMQADSDLRASKPEPLMNHAIVPLVLGAGLAAVALYALGFVL